MGQFCMGGVQREISVSCLKVGLRHVEATRVAETGQEEEAQVGQWTQEEPLSDPVRCKAYAAWMFEACIPFGPLVASKVTF